MNCRGLIHQTRTSGRHKCRPYNTLKKPSKYPFGGIRLGFKT